MVSEFGRAGVEKARCIGGVTRGAVVGKASVPPHLSSTTQPAKTPSGEVAERGVQRMPVSRRSGLLNAVVATVFITVIAGIVLWIIIFIAVAEAERAFEALGLLARSWQRDHLTQLIMVTGIVWTPVIAVVAAWVLNRFLATEQDVRNG